MKNKDVIVFMLRNIVLFKFYFLFSLSCLAENITIVVSIDGFSSGSMVTEL